MPPAIIRGNTVLLNFLHFFSFLVFRSCFFLWLVSVCSHCWSFKASRGFCDNICLVQYYNLWVWVRINCGSQMNSNATLQKQWCLSEFHNYLIMSMWVHKFFKWMISSSNFVVIAWLVVLARKDPGTSRLHWAIILFSCNKDPFDGINELNVEDTATESFYLQ